MTNLHLASTKSLKNLQIDAGFVKGYIPSIGMDLRLLKERYGDKLCFFGGVNCH